jgi:hypothetical protein
MVALGIQLLFLGVLGEYLGKLFMAHSGLPPYVIKKQVKGKQNSATYSVLVPVLFFLLSSCFS